MSPTVFRSSRKLRDVTSPPAARNPKIPHSRILQELQEPRDGTLDFVEIYRRQVLPVKTRTIRLLGRKAPARINTTLLGYEVQASYKRIHCPDLVTARYLRLFTEIGCHAIRLPYDPTITGQLIPELENRIGSIKTGIRGLFPESKATQTYVLRKIYGILRSRLRAE